MLKDQGTSISFWVTWQRLNTNILNPPRMIEDSPSHVDSACNEANLFGIIVGFVILIGDNPVLKVWLCLQCHETSHKTLETYIHVPASYGLS